MNKTLIEIINKAKAVKTTNDALIESFERYIHLLMQLEIDYEYIKVDEFKKTLKHNSSRMALYESRLNSLTEEENFNHFCRYVHLQIEGLLNYYLSMRYPSSSDFKLSYAKKIKSRLELLCNLNFDEFKTEYGDFLIELENPEITEEAKQEIISKFNSKYENSLMLYLKHKYDLKVYISPDEEKRIKADYDYSVIDNGIKEIEDKFTEISRVPFAYKFEYFLLSYEIDTNHKISIEALTDYRNKELSHSGELTLSLTRNAKALKERKNFMALKDSLQEINQLVKINS
jgi:hypothetical protein